AARLAAVADSGATALVQLTGDEDATGRQLAAAASDVDVVIDYLWGSATAAALVPLVMRRADRRRKLTWIEVGSVVGSEASIPSAALRAARLDIVGSGQGSVSTEEIVAELPSLVKAIASRSLTVDAQEFPLEDVERVWRTQLAARVVLRP
ncbi:MAG: zinc-binding alcohol dehydrogenase family protein, partial [Chloroflexi bacterium]|nr:zinc-binding alcohol dehydrogenase family protein [Chloroflexota bacterium]